MNSTVKIAKKIIGDENPVFIIAEIGMNHNGDLDIAQKIIDVAIDSGCDAVKFQKRSVEHSIPLEQLNAIKDTPWGKIPYIEYRRLIEFGKKEFDKIDRYCRKNKILWFASCWDLPSIEFMAIMEV